MEPSTIALNIASVRTRIAAACGRAGRDPSSVTIVSVSKGIDLARIRESLRAGLPDIGENRIPEALEKYRELAGRAPRPVWHMIGHLQRNKAREAVRIFDLIHSVDSVRLAEELDRQAAKQGKVQEILIEVNISGEESKYGIAPGELDGLLDAFGGLEHVRARGLMCMAPFSEDPEDARPFFRALRELRDARRGRWPGLEELSMGMSGDFETAVEEGATLVRIGRAIFEGI